MKHRQIRRLRRTAVAGTVLGIFAVGVAGCSSSSSSTTSAPSTANSTTASSTVAGVPTTPYPQPDAAAAQAAGVKAASISGNPVSLPVETIGILNIAEAAQSAAGVQAQTEAAAKLLGWQVIACDGQGTPTIIESCGQSLVSQHVDAIVSIGNDPTLWQPALTRAHAAGIPVVNVAGAVGSSPDIVASYASDNAAEGKKLAEYVMTRLKEVSGTKSVDIGTFPAGWATSRTDAFESAAKANGVQIASQWTTNGADVQSGTQQQVSAALTQNPNVNAIWLSYSDALPPAGAVVSEKYAGKTFPNRPLVVGFGQETSILGAIRDGQVDVSAEDAIDATGWMAIDQFAEYFARKAPIDTDPLLSKYDFPFYSTRLFTKQNIPASGPVPYASDFIAFFQAKWAKEFGK